MHSPFSYSMLKRQNIHVWAERKYVNRARPSCRAHPPDRAIEVWWVRDRASERRKKNVESLRIKRLSRKKIHQIIFYLFSGKKKLSQIRMFLQSAKWKIQSMNKTIAEKKFIKQAVCIRHGLEKYFYRIWQTHSNHFYDINSP